MRSRLAVVAIALVAAASASAGRTPGFLGCSAFLSTSRQKPAVRPPSIVVACADGGLLLKKLHWSSWSAAGARAHGNAVANDCAPTCVAGHFHTYRATVKLSRPRACHGRLLFTRLELTYHGSSATQMYPAC